MIVLALDTCDARGSLAVLRDDEVLNAIAYAGTSDFSSWVLPTTEAALRASGVVMRDVRLLAVATGPGTFTGVRIGLTTVKAWSEACKIPIAGVSRLAAMASQATIGGEYVAACVDAHREQVFGGLYHRDESGLSLVETEMVASPSEFLHWVSQRAGTTPVTWISMDPARLTAVESWGQRIEAGDRLEVSAKLLASAVGRVGRQRELQGCSVDALALDAEYIRRPDAEVFWKGVASRAR